MKKGPILKSLAIGVALYTAAGFWGVPYLLENVVPGKVAEATKGGKFTVEEATFNPYSFHLVLKGVSFKTPENGDLFSLAALSLNVDPAEFVWRGEWTVKEVVLNEPALSVYRNKKGAFNFQWLTELGGDEAEEKESSTPPRLFVRHFDLVDGRIDYRDEAEGKAYALGVGPIGFGLDNVDLRDLSGANGKLRLYATINDGGFVSVNGNVDSLSPLVVGGNFGFDSGKLYTAWRYFKEKFPIEVADGTIKTGFDFRFDSADVNATELSNLAFELSTLRVIPKGKSHNLLSVGSVRLDRGNVLPLRREFRADAVSIGGIDVAARRSAEGKIDWITYAEQIKAAFPEDENETKEPWKWRIGKVAVENVAAQWSDDAPGEPYRLSLANGRLHAEALSSDEASPLAATVATDGVVLSRQRDSATVASVGAIAVEGIGIDRKGRFAEVAKVRVQNPSASLKRFKDGSLDLSRLLYAAPPPPPSDEPSALPWGYRIGEIDLSGGHVALGDEVPTPAVAMTLEGLGVNVKNLHSNPALPLEYRVSTTINAKTALEAHGDLVRSHLRSRGTFDLKRFNAAWVDPYLAPATHASLRRGTVSVAGEYDYAPPKASVKGKVALSDWVVNDGRDNSVLLGWESIGATPFVYAYPDNRLKINQLAVEGLYTNALIDEKRVLNYTTLSKAPKRDANATAGVAAKGGSNPFGIDIVKLLVHDSSATFSDLSLPLPFKTYIHDLNGQVLGISTTKDVSTFVKLRGGVDRYGLARIDGSLNTKDPKGFTDMKVAFDNLELEHYTPYSLQFLGYKIDGGKLFLDLGYKINAGQLRADNKVVIKQIELGAEKEGGSPWPMRLVVALLEDTNGVIDIDLPIEGDVNKPDFKYGKLVWQVIGNILTKAVTAPFRFLSSMLGIESEKLSTIDFEAGSVALLPPQVEKLDRITQMLQKRPKISLEVFGTWSEERDAYVLKGKKLVALALARDKKHIVDSPHAIALEVLEDMADDMIGKKERKGIENRLEEHYKQEAEFVRHYSAELIERLIEKQGVTPQELSALGAARAETIRTYLLKTPGLEARVSLKPSEATKALDSGEIPLRLGVVVQK